MKGKRTSPCVPPGFGKKEGGKEGKRELLSPARRKKTKDLPYNACYRKGGGLGAHLREGKKKKALKHSLKGGRANETSVTPGT